MAEIRIYNLRIVPTEPVFTEIVAFKKQFETVFGRQILSRSKPHCTIAAFKMDMEYEKFLLNALHQLSDTKCFPLKINDFGIFENTSKTLILNIQRSQEMEHLRQILKIVWIRELHRKLSSINISTTAHITISKTTGTKMLQESLAYFQQKKYIKTFEVTHLTLVSRRANKTWDSNYNILLE
ncbi:2'-5' RNA ligase family protein [Flavimarina sp. Hel_I_48]|uniref:2'-5' RNA ligase family protein n=1 Tax=Flavimarina sp. Hel_I_48 TaxID=1392488 RepID=UPI0004DF6F03|nr:2'-5' RNA ligase family protein [Flavimarina sp. Hel_I_48]